ncbi:hypothetical protein ACFE04_006265 [Oxalis oulophora]
MIKPNHLFYFSLIQLLTLHFTVTTVLAKTAPGPAAPEAPGPAPPGPTNITKILEKGGQFTIFIKLLKATSVSDQLYHQLNDSNNGVTIFAPSDNAFSNLKPGTLNSLNDQQKVELVQFHVVPQFISMSNFQTVSNPLRTNAGDTADGLFPLNVTNSGNSVNITTGLTNTSVSGTVYTDDQVAVYQVDKVLLPQGVFDPKPPPPPAAPAPESEKKKSRAVSSESDKSNEASSGFVVKNYGLRKLGFAIGIITVIISL